MKLYSSLINNMSFLVSFFKPFNAKYGLNSGTIQFLSFGHAVRSLVVAWSAVLCFNSLSLNGILI
jgi:hypothetical protein